MQNHISPKLFSERTDALAFRMGIPLRELGGRIGISTAMIFAYRSGKHPISGKAWAKVVAAEQKSEQPYRISGGLDARKVEEPPANYGRMLTPGYEGRPAEPSEQQCIDYFLTYLAAARQEPGGIGYTWRQLQKFFPHDEFAPVKKAPPP